MELATERPILNALRKLVISTGLPALPSHCFGEAGPKRSGGQGGGNLFAKNLEETQNVVLLIHARSIEWGTNKKTSREQ